MSVYLHSVTSETCPNLQGLQTATPPHHMRFSFLYLFLNANISLLRAARKIKNFGKLSGARVFSAGRVPRSDGDATDKCDPYLDINGQPLNSQPTRSSIQRLFNFLFFSKMKNTVSMFTS